MRLVTVCAAAEWVGCGSDDAGPGGGDGAGGANTGGASTGGDGTGGDGTGGAAGSCALALLVKGSNYGADPHDLSIPLADLQAGVNKTYTTTGMGHTHSVTLTDVDFTALRNGETVKKYVCYDNPNNTDHEFVISCADPSVIPTFEGEIGTAANCPA